MKEKQLNLTIPEDAIQIIDKMTEEVAFAKKDAKIFIACVNTINKAISELREIQNGVKDYELKIDELEKKLVVPKNTKNGK